MSMMINPYMQTSVFAYPALTLVNPGGETGNMTGWTASVAIAVNNTSSSSWPGPAVGTWYFELTSGGNAYQDVTMPPAAYARIDTGMVQFNVTAKFSTYNAVRNGVITLKAYDAANAVIGTSEPIALETVHLSWADYQTSIKLPIGTRSVRVTMSKTGVSGTTWYDNLQVSLSDYSGANTSYTNSGGKGDRTGVVTVTSSGFGGGGGSLSAIVNGSYANSFWWETGANAGLWLKFDFGSPKIVDQLFAVFSDYVSQGVWAVEGSNDNTTWTTLLPSFTLDRGMVSFPNTTAYRYYRWLGVSGSRSRAYYLQEVEFRIL